ncbi:MAG: hypothetical protein ABI665_20915 [Vicinamibacterales bacterium]
MSKGDVVIRLGGPNPEAEFVVSAFPGPGQLACATRVDAERLAMAYANHAGVDAWFDEGPNGFTLLGHFREPAGPRLVRSPARRRLAL